MGQVDFKQTPNVWNYGKGTPSRALLALFTALLVVRAPKFQNLTIIAPMRILSFPKELKTTGLLPVQVHDYHSSKEISKQRIVLETHLFSFLLEGKKEVIFDNSQLSSDSSHFLVMKSGHCLMTEKPSEINHYRSVLLFFTNEQIESLIRKHGLKAPTLRDEPSVYSFAYDDFMKRFAYSLLDISQLPGSVQEQMLKVKLEEVMLYLTSIHGVNFLYALANINPDTQRFIHVVESNQLNKLSLKELAFLCNMSVSTFKRKFEAHFGEPPMRWFQNKRLEHAHYLINQEQKISSAIYLEAGYESLSSFIQAYKAKYGITPKQHQLI